MPVSQTVSKSIHINVLNFVCNVALVRLKCLLVCIVITMIMDFQIAHGIILSGIVYSIIHFLLASLHSPRTSDSLNEGLPINMARKKFQRK